MRVRLSTRLDCTAEAAWAEVLKPSLLLHVSFPLAIIRPVGQDAFPPVWEDGGTYQCRSFLFGIIPVGRRRIRLERVDHARREIQSRETDHLAKRWDHLISITADPEGGALYRDEVEIEAGLLTPVVWAWAALFYRHRQRRWRRLARTLTVARPDGR